MIGKRNLYRALGGASLLLLGCGEEAPPPHEPVVFVDVAQQAGLHGRNVSGKPQKTYIIESKGGGAGLFDYDNDGYLDAYLINGSSFDPLPDPPPSNRLYRNRGDGTFAEVTRTAGVGDTAWSMGCGAADYDNDGDTDLLATNYGPNRLYRNRGDGTFAEVAQAAGVADPRWSTGVAWGDYDVDGDVDLYVANFVRFNPDELAESDLYQLWKGIKIFQGPNAYEGEQDVLYRNRGDGTFEDVTTQVGVDPVAYNGFQPVFVDSDSDGYLDLYVANDTDPNLLWRNLGNGRFKDVSLATGASHSADGEEQAGMGVAVGDYDNDGDFDFFVTHFSEDYYTLYRSEEGRLFTDVSHAVGVGEVSMPFVGWGTGFFDRDNDGDLDLFAANGHVYPVLDDYDVGTRYAQRNFLFDNDGRGSFVEIGAQAGSGLAVEKVSRGAAFGDYDNDGDIDILILNIDDTPTLLRNDGGNQNHWLQVSLIGTASNRDGIGARIEAEIAGRVQIRQIAAGTSFLSHSDTRAHFGLQRDTKVEQLVVRWPGGRVEEFRDLDADQWLVITEGKGLAVRRTQGNVAGL